MFFTNFVKSFTMRCVKFVAHVMSSVDRIKVEAKKISVYICKVGESVDIYNSVIWCLG